MTGKTVAATSKILLISFMFLASTTLGHSASSGDALQDKISELLRVIEQQGRQLQAQQQAIEAQDRRFLEYQQQTARLLEQQQANIENLQSRLGLTAPDGAPQGATAAVTAPPAAPQPAPEGAPAGSQSSGATLSVGRPAEPPKESRPPEIAAIFDQPGVLTPRRTLIVEPSLQYTHSTSKRLFLLGFTILPALHIGPFDLRDVRRNAYVAALAARYGVTNRLELELKVPYLYRTEDSSTHRYVTPDSLNVLEMNSSSDGMGLGDVEFGLRYQLNQPKGGPYYIAGLRVKTETGESPFEVSGDDLPTGSGFWGVQPNLTAIFASDPAVFFGGLNYMWNMAKDVGGDFGELDPGDAYGFNFGMGLALNEKASFSMGYEHSIISRTKREGEVLPGQVDIHVGNFQLGYSYRLTDKTNLNLALGLGVTEDAPDVQLTLKAPMSLLGGGRY